MNDHLISNLFMRVNDNLTTKTTNFIDDQTVAISKHNWSKRIDWSNRQSLLILDLFFVWFFIYYLSCLSCSSFYILPYLNVYLDLKK